jgi:hypothetical protein
MIGLIVLFCVLGVAAATAPVWWPAVLRWRRQRSIQREAQRERLLQEQERRAQAVVAVARERVARQLRPPPLEPPGTVESGPALVTAIEIAIARQTSMAGPAVATLVLYFVLFIPGLLAYRLFPAVETWVWWLVLFIPSLITNRLFLKEAQRLRTITGSDPPGTKALETLMILGWLVVAVWVIAPIVRWWIKVFKLA